MENRSLAMQSCWKIFFILFAYCWSPFFAANSSPVKTGKPDAALHGDSVHDVVVIPECNLAVRFNKQSERIIPVFPFVNEDVPGFPHRKPYFTVSPLKSILIYENFSAIEILRSPAKFGIECVHSSSWKPDKTMSKDFLQINALSRVDLNREDFCRAIGLRLESCKIMKHYQAYIARGKKSNAEYPVYLWDAGSLTYIMAEKGNLNYKGKKLIELDIQINSLAPSVFTINLSDSRYHFYYW